MKDPNPFLGDEVTTLESKGGGIGGGGCKPPPGK